MYNLLMVKRAENLPNPNQRELIKHNKMEYAYQTSVELGRLPILGSLMRAVGKGWSVCVITSTGEMPQFQAIQNLLLDKGAINVISEEDVAQLDFTKYQLLIFQGIPAETINQIRNKPQVLGKMHVMATEDHATDDYDLISKFNENNINRTGVTAVTGTGKGKTTSALGLAAEPLMRGQKVTVIQWFKERKSGDLTWAISEHQFPMKLVNPNLLEFYPTGLGFFGSPNMDRVKGEEAYLLHRAKAYEGIEIAKQMINSGEFGLVVLDELVDTVKEIAQNIEYPLIDLPDIQQFLAFCALRKTPAVVTGRRVSSEWSQFIGKSIVISEIKHPWSSKRKGAVSGLDF